jgi:tetratricopeptide (TPR) repeat protein
VHASNAWLDVADQVLLKDDVVDGIKKLKNGHVGLTVLINRYDGIDLPDAACRVLALVDLPEVASYIEMFDETILDNSSLGLKRQVERIEQGMGRGVRSNSDYCSVLLVGSKLTARVRSKEAEQFLTPATRAQLELSRKIAMQLKTPSIEQIKDVISQCLSRDPDWIKFSKKALVNLATNNELNLDAGKLALKKSLDLTRSNQYDEAIDVLSEAVNQTSEDEEKAWLLYYKASIQNCIDAEGAQKALRKAHSLERGIMKPLQGISYKKISANNHQQAKALIDYHSHRFLGPVDVSLHADELCTDLRFNDSISSNKFEAAINDLARFLGIIGHRPENEFNEGPDNLWASSDGVFFIIECKNRITSNNGIAKHDAGQLGQSVSWFQRKYPGSSYYPVIIHPLNTLGTGASAIDGMRCINDNKLKELRTALKSFSKELMNPDVNSSLQEIHKRLIQYKFSSDQFINAYTVPINN